MNGLYSVIIINGFYPELTFPINYYSDKNPCTIKGTFTSESEIININESQSLYLYGADTTNFIQYVWYPILLDISLLSPNSINYIVILNSNGTNNNSNINGIRKVSIATSTDLLNCTISTTNDNSCQEGTLQRCINNMCILTLPEPCLLGSTGCPNGLVKVSDDMNCCCISENPPGNVCITDDQCIDSMCNNNQCFTGTGVTGPNASETSSLTQNEKLAIGLAILIFVLGFIALFIYLLVKDKRRSTHSYIEMDEI